MRCTTLIPFSIVLLSALLLSTLSAAGKDESLDQLIVRAQAAKLSDQPGLYLDIAERKLKSADRAYIDGKPAEGEAAVKDLLTYADKAHDAARDSGKKLKNSEITLRKMAAKLRDIKRTQSVDDQDALQKAADHLEDLRTDLLTHMFGKGAK